MRLPDNERSHLYRDMNPLTESMVKTAGPHNAARESMIETLRPYEFKSALELGCSVGTAIVRLKEEFDLAVCLGVDFCEAAIDEARKLNEGKGVCFTVADAEELGCGPAGMYDLVLTCGVLMHCGPNLYRNICRNILAFEPRLIFHQEIQGDEELIENCETINHFKRSHDYIGTYQELGVPAERIKVVEFENDAGLMNIIVEME